MGKRKRPEQIKRLLVEAERDLAKGLSVSDEDLADRAGIHRTYLSDIERGSRNVSLINVEKIAMALTLSLAELFERVDRS